QLLDNSVELSKNLEVTPGVSLTKEQVDSLTKDIVWYETEMINNEKVLVPKLYLSKVTKENVQITEDGLVSAGSMVLTGDVKNDGKMIVKEKIFASGNIDNSGVFKAGNGGMEILSDSFTNSGTVSSGGNSIFKVKQLTNSNSGVIDSVGSSYFSVTDLLNKGDLTSGENMLIEAKGDVTNYGGKIKANKALSIFAEGNIFNSSYGTTRDNDYSDFTNKGLIEAGTTLTLDTKGKLINEAAILKSGGDAFITAQEGIESRSVEIKSWKNVGPFWDIETEKKTTNVNSVFDFGGNMVLSSTNNANFVGTDLSVGGSADIDVNDFTFTSTQNSFSSTDKNKKKVTTQKNKFNVGGDLYLTGNDATFTAADVDVKGNGVLDINNLSLISTADSSSKSYKGGAFFSPETHKSEKKTHIGTSFKFGKSLNVDSSNIKLSSSSIDVTGNVLLNNTGTITI
ncbi:MAG: hypothetical protein OIF32_02235, partial [Campylobacterales bacterium]|nr:hypothetical protein [Campylobacterales bacterium]